MNWWKMIKPRITSKVIVKIPFNDDIVIKTDNIISSSVFIFLKLVIFFLVWVSGFMSCIGMITLDLKIMIISMISGLLSVVLDRIIMIEVITKK